MNPVVWENIASPTSCRDTANIIKINHPSHESAAAPGDIFCHFYMVGVKSSHCL